MDSSSWIDDLSALSGFMSHLEGRLDIAAASSIGATSSGLGGHSTHEQEEGAWTSSGLATAAPARRARGPEGGAPEVKTKALARLWRAMDDDGRRHYSDQPVDTAGTGLDGPFGDEYRALFGGLETTQFDKASTKVQTVWRGRKKRQRMGRWRANRAKRLKLHFRAWVAVTNAVAFFQKVLCKWVFNGWRQVVADGQRTRHVTWEVFRGRIGHASLSISAVNLFFADPVAEPPDPLCANALRLGVRRQVLIKLLKAWHDQVKAWQRCRTQAVITLQRALRLNPEAPKARWAPELKALVFHMWHRSVTYKRCFKTQARLPTFRDPDLPEWHAWLRSYMRKQLLKQKADKRGLSIFKLNKLRRWRWYTRYMKGLVGRFQHAAQYYRDGLLSKVLRYWLRHTRCRGRLLRRRVVYFTAWKHWAPRKKRLRQLKQLLAMKVAKACAQHGLRQWTLALNNARLVKAFRLRRIAEPTLFFPVMSTMYLLSGQLANYYVLYCFQRWQLLRTRRNAWKAFHYLHQRGAASHLLRTVFRAWHRGTAKWSEDTLSLEPLAALTHARSLASQALSGYRPEPGLPRAAVSTLLPAQDEPEGAAPPLASKPRVQLTDLETELLAAIASGDAAAVETLLERGARVDFVGPGAGDGQTPLHHAAAAFAERHLNVVALLLHCGADVHRRDALGRRAVDLATNPQVAALLHAHGARVVAAPTQAELGNCAQLMAMQWNELGALSMWRYVAHGLAGVRAGEIDKDVARELKTPGEVSPTRPKLNVAVARKRCRRLASVRTALEEAQRLPEDSSDGSGGSEVGGEGQGGDEKESAETASEHASGAVQGSLRSERRSSLDGITDPDDENEEEPETVRRRQALRWLSNWSKKQDDRTLHFDASAIINMQGEKLIPRRLKLENIAWKALIVCEAGQLHNLQLLRETRHAEFERDAYLLKAALRRSIMQDYAALYQTMPPKMPRPRKLLENVPSLGVDSSASSPLPLLSVVPDAVPDRLHAFAASRRRIKINQEVPLLCEGLRASIPPVEFLHLCADEATAATPFWPSDLELVEAPADDASGEGGVVVPRQWRDLSRIGTLLRAELSALQGRRSAASHEGHQQTLQLKVLSECQHALGQADASTEEGVWTGSEDLREQDAELLNTRRRVRGVIMARDREVMKRRKMIVSLEGQLELAHSAQADRAKMSPAEQVQASEAEPANAGGKALPSVSWMDSQLSEYTAFRLAQVAALQQAISKAEAKADAAKHQLVALITDFEHQRSALRSSNVLKLVIMDDLKDARCAVGVEVKATDKRARQFKARVEVATADVHHVRLALAALGLAETDDAAYDPYASLVVVDGSPAKRGSGAPSASDRATTPNPVGGSADAPPSGRFRSDASSSLSQGLALALPRGEPLSSVASDPGGSFEGQSGPLSRAAAAYEGKSRPATPGSQPATSRSALSAPLTSTGLAATYRDDGKEDGDGDDDFLENDAPTFRLEGLASASDDGNEISETPRFDVDFGGDGLSFEQDIVDRYQEALGSLFPDERIKLVGVKKKELEKNSNSDAELLELQKEFGYLGDEEARGEVPQEVPPDGGTLEPTGKLRKDWNRIALTKSSLPQEEAPLQPAFRLSASVVVVAEALDMRPTSTLPPGTRMHFTFGNVGESDPGALDDDLFFVPEDAMVVPLAETVAAGGFEPAAPDAFGASVSMENDDPPAANDVEALLLEEMSAEEKVERRLKTVDSFLDVGRAQDALFEAAAFVSQHTAATNDEPASGRSFRRGKSRTGARNFSEQSFQEDHALEVPTAASSAVSPMTSPVDTPARSAAHATTTAPLVARAHSPAPVLSVVTVVPAPAPANISASASPARTVPMTNSNADAPFNASRGATTEATAPTPATATTATSVSYVESLLAAPPEATPSPPGSPGSLASGGSVVSNSGTLRSLDDCSVRSLTIANELEPGISELLLEGRVAWPISLRPGGPSLSALEGDFESNAGFDDFNLDAGGSGRAGLDRNGAAAAGGDQMANASASSASDASSSPAGGVAKGKGAAGGGATNGAGNQRRAGPLVASRLQQWAAELADKKMVQLDKEQNEAAREQRRQNGGASRSSTRKQTAERCDAPEPASDTATTKEARRAARRNVPPKTPAVLGKDGIVIVGVPIDVGTKEAALAATGGSTVETIAEKPSLAVAAVLSGAEQDLPEMTDAEFIAWMETFIEASNNQETPDEEEMLQQYAVRQAARRAALTAVPRSGISGLRRGRPAALGGLAAGDASLLPGVAGVSTFQSARPASRESLPEIPFSHATGVKLVLSDEGSTYNRYQPEEQVQRGANSRPPAKEIARDQLRGAASTLVSTSHGALPETFELTGDGLKLPAINQLRAAKMTWSGTLPALVSAMSTADKEKAWQTFEQMELSSAAKEAYAELLADEPELEPEPSEPEPEAFITLPPIDSARRRSAETETTGAAGASFTPEAFWHEEDDAVEQAAEVKLSLEFEATKSRSSARSPPSAAFERRAEEAEEEEGEGDEDDEERNEEQLDQALRAMLSSLEGKFWDEGPRQPRAGLGGPIFEPLPAPSSAPKPTLPRAGLAGASMAIGGAAHANGRRPPAPAPALREAKKAAASAQRAPRAGPRGIRASAASRPLAAAPVRGSASAVAAAAATMAEELPGLFIDLGAADNPRPRSPETPMPVFGGPRQAPGARQPLVASAPTPTPPAPPSTSFADAAAPLEPMSPLSVSSQGGNPSPPPLEPRSAAPSDSSGASPSTKKPPPLDRTVSGKQPQVKKQDSYAKPKRGLFKAVSTTDKKDGKAKDKKKGSTKKKKGQTARSGASLAEDDGEEGGEDGPKEEDDDTAVTVTLDQIMSERIPEQPYVAIREAKKVDRLTKKEKVHSWSLLSKADIKKASRVEKALIKPFYKEVDDEDKSKKEPMAAAELGAEFNRRRREAAFGSTANFDTDDD